MKRMIKKTLASLLALLMMIQIIPALAATYSSGMIVGSAQGYKELMAIVASKGTYVLLGQTLVLDVNEDYQPEWESGNEAVATIDEQGVITAIAAGNATITATVKNPKLQTATIEITVIDPEPILTSEASTEEGQEPENGQETQEGQKPENEQPEDGQETENQTPASPEQKTLVIVINGENDRITYDGEEHILDRFVATANEEFFDESKIRVEGELAAIGKDCGIYEMNLEGATFIYDDPEVTAHFVKNNGFLKITPASVTVTANEAFKNAGETDPELTATVVGLFGNDTIDYTLTRDRGEAAGEYMINAAGEEMQGNYHISYVAGRFEISGEPVVEIESSIIPGQRIFSGTEITLKARPIGFGGAALTYQWQYSTDGENWTDIAGANESVYKYIVNKENAKYYYRVTVERAD